MTLSTPEKELDVHDNRFLEVCETFAEKFQYLVDEFIYIAKAKRLHEECQELVAKFYARLEQRRNMQMSTNAMLEEIVFMKQACMEADALLGSLCKSISRYHQREQEKKRKEKIQGILMYAGMFGFLALFIFVYIKWRMMF